MNTDIVNSVLQWLNTHGEYSWLITFIISASESVAIIGTIVPGSITMTAIGALAGAGIIPLWSTLFWAFLGAIVGDGISYWIGFYFKDRIRLMWPFNKNLSLLGKGERFFNRYGGMGVFIGRFVGPIRALIPVVAGMMGMTPWRFTIANIASAALWAPAYMLPGIVLGAASLELPPDIATRVMLILLFWTLFILLCLWLIRKIPAIIHQQIIRSLNALWSKLQRSRHGGLIKTLLRHHNPAHISTQLTLFFYFILVSAAFVYLANYIKTYGSESLFINQSIYHLFRGIYTTDGKNIMVFLTLLGQKQVLLPAAALVIAWLFIKKRWHIALHAAGLFCLTAASVVLIKHNVQSVRPWGVLEAPESFSFPSGHTTLTTVFYIGLALLIAKHLKFLQRKLSYTLALLMVVIMSVSRLYLGVHWFTDIIGAWLLSAALLILITILYNRYQDKSFKVKKLLLVTFSALTFIYIPAACYYVPKLQNELTKLDFPTQEADMNTWWDNQDKDFLPEWRVSLIGLPSQSINLEWADQLPAVEKTLMRSGWQTPPDRAWIDILFRVSGIQSSEHLPLISPFYLDKKPALVLVKQVRKDKILVLQLWPSNRVLSKTHEPIWVGIVGLVPRTYGWLSHHNKMDIDITANLVFNGKNSAQHKIIRVMIPGKRRERVQTILLVR